MPVPEDLPKPQDLPVTTQQGDQAEAVPASKARRLTSGLRSVGRTLAAAAASLNRALNQEHHHKNEAVQATGSAADHEAELRQAFALYDRNGDGTIDIFELRAVLHAMGQHPGKRELRALMDRMDTDGSGAIDFEEFAVVMRVDHAEAQETEPEMKQMQNLFRVIDRDGSGKLSPIELQAAIKAMGVMMSRAEVEFLVTQIDTDGDGEVDCPEFLAYLFKTTSAKPS